MDRPRRLSSQALSVLEALAGHSPEWLYGLKLSEWTRLKSGSLYPILIRLADRGFVESRWIEPSTAGRPPRHAYRILPQGLGALAAAEQASTPARLRESRT
jgi:DNA-binding PadR family transcriptional regulator